MFSSLLFAYERERVGDHDLYLNQAGYDQISLSLKEDSDYRFYVLYALHYIVAYCMCVYVLTVSFLSP